MDKPDVLAIDADLIVYKAASVAQRNYIVVEHIKSKRKKEFDTRTDFYGHHAKKARGWLAEVNDERELQGKPKFSVEEFTITDHVDPAPVSYACQTAKQMIEGICKGAGVDKYELFLSGDSNFREDVATIYKYKGDRDKLVKPVHVKAVKEYMIKRHKAVVCDGEADDHLAILAEAGTHIQCTTDKDATQAKGWCYDYDKAEAPFEVKDNVGLLWIGKTPSDKDKIRGVGFKQLMWQMLVGDKVDCIFPRHLNKKVKYGEKTAYNDLKPLKSKKECLEFVLSKYKEWYPDIVMYPHWDTGQMLNKNYFEIAEEMFLLLYMHRVQNDSTTLKSLCKESGVVVDEI